MKICSQCKTINTDGALFCYKCGTRLGASQDGSQKSGNQQQPQYKTNPQYRSSYSLSDEIKDYMNKYASFKGRATRAEFWTIILSHFILILIAGRYAAFTGRISGIMFVIIVLGSICPSISVLVRRLHDTGRSGWWFWIGFIPFGGIVLLVFTLLDSQDHDNKYGPGPYTMR